MSHPTRDTLLQAGLRLAEIHGLNSMSINAIVAEAKVAKGTFYVHFANRAEYLVALHRWFHDELRAAIVAAITDTIPGLTRLQQATSIYLDTCLRSKAVKALLLEARSDPAITSEIQQRNADFAALAYADFQALGWPHPDISARLYIVMVAEVALIELEAGHALPDVRESLAFYLQRGSV